MTAYIVLGALLVCSVGVNALLIWHNRRLIGDLNFIEEETTELEETIREFSDHLELIYGLETFYGDETLKNLLRHSKAVGTFIKKFKNTTTLLFTEEELEEEEDDEIYNESEDEESEDEGVPEWRGDRHDFGLVR